MAEEVADKKTQKIKATQHDSYKALTILSFFLPLVGFIIGIVFLAKSTKLDRKLGEHLVAFSVFMGIVGIIFWSIVFSSGSHDTNQSATTTSAAQQPAPAAPKVWDYQTAYDKIQIGMTKADVEVITGKTSDSCTESQNNYTGKMEWCSYGNAFIDKASISITYTQDKVSDKTKSSY